jgi:hypothetical protein
VSRQPLDWSKTGTVCAMADWLMKDGDAICVLVIRPHDSVFSVDPKCAPSEAERLVLEYLPHLTSRVAATRKEQKQAARLVQERCPE